jgi:sesquipedalian
VNKAFQKRYFKLKGNLLFYFDKKGGDLLGMIVLEGCVIELAEDELENYCFYINFVGNRKYILASDNQQDMESWMRALTCSGFDYMKIMVSEMQRQLEEFEKTPNPNSSNSQPSTSTTNETPPVPPRRQNPFNKFNNCK